MHLGPNLGVSDLVSLRRHSLPFHYLRVTDLEIPIATGIASYPNTNLGRLVDNGNTNTNTNKLAAPSFSCAGILAIDTICEGVMAASWV